MEKPELGTLEPVDLREVWRDEARDFTLWLSQNLAKLSEQIDVDLDLDAVEVPVGPYRADIIATDLQTKTKVIIENQLERTNHDHLGKIIIYASGLEAACVIWIAREFTEEHRRALDYLNEKTVSDMRFFGIEIQLFRIGDSVPAPFFRVIASPNEYAAAVRNTERERSEAETLYFEFWSGFKEYCQDTGTLLNLRKPRHQHWFSFAVGRSRFEISLTASMQYQRLACEIYIKGKNAKKAFALLQQDKAAIEKVTGALDWRELPDKQDCRILLYNPDFDISDRNEWPTGFRWLKSEAEAFHTAFSSRIKALPIEGDDSEGEDGS